MSTARVLVVEDTDTLRHLLARVLRGEGYEATFAESGEAAVEALRRASFDLLLTDRALPGLDGIGVLSAAKRLHPLMPSVLFTGYLSQQVEQEAQGAGAAACLAKPFSIGTLREVCGRLLGRAQPMRAQPVDEVRRSA